MDSRLYLITAARPDFDDLLEAAVRGGVDVVQIREKSLTDRELLAVLERARELTRRLGVPLVVNDRPDLALVCGADYVHLGQDDLPRAAAMRFGVPVGVSTHDAGQLAAAAGAAYAGVGPVHATPTKAGRAATGLEYVRHAASAATLPWFAIGGVDRTNVEQVVAAGATRIAVVRAIGDAADPESAAAELRAALEAVPAGP